MTVPVVVLVYKDQTYVSRMEANVVIMEEFWLKNDLETAGGFDRT